MRILGIDPGSKTTGWALLNVGDAGMFVVASGEFDGDSYHAMPDVVLDSSVCVAIERPVPQGATRPDVVECAIVAGSLQRSLSNYPPAGRAHWITRLEVRRALQDAVQGAWTVRDDKSVWQALVALFGSDSDRKPKRKKGVLIDAGGPLGDVKGHARAALAIAVAWWLKRDGGKL